MTANLEKRLRKSLGNEALEKRIAELEASVLRIQAHLDIEVDATLARLLQRDWKRVSGEPAEEPKKRGRPKKPKPE